MITHWLQQFGQSWQSHDIDAIVALFEKDVEYWETPFQRLNSINEVKSEWAAIKNQFDIRLTTSLYAEADNLFTVKWNLFYKNEFHQEAHWSGVYLIKLNSEGKCTYFYQVGESQS